MLITKSEEMDTSSYILSIASQKEVPRKGINLDDHRLPLG